MSKFDLAKSPKFDRSLKTPSEDLRVERTGGKWGAGVIYGASLITVGEALGHYTWIDQEFIESVTKHANKQKTGLKIRFTHPGLSGDGLGRFMGRAFNAVTEGEQSKADIHFQKSAHETPDGDLATYLMDLAEEDPQAFAMSIVFRHDRGEEERHRAKHKDDRGRFLSPDPRNTNNFEHARLAELRAADFVDEPAANPGGLFHRGHEVAEEAEHLMSYALGLTDERPALTTFDADPDRLAAFTKRFLHNNKLEIRSLDMAKETDTTKPGEGSDKTDLAATLTKFGEDLLSKVDAKLEAFGKGITPVEAKLEQTDGPSAEQAATAERERCKQLAALAKNSGLADHEQLLSSWIDKGLSIESAKAHIGELAIERNKLSSDGGTPADDPDAKYKAEYRKDMAIYLKHGVTVEQYIVSRKVDEGRELLTTKQ